MKTLNLIGATVMLVALTACGGGGGPPDTVPVADNNEVPASAGASIEAFGAYLASLAVDDTAEPKSLEKMSPPASETAEPMAIR
jgi:hypothetical protein